MSDCRVTCITKTQARGSHEHISALGNSQANWVWPREAVILSIESKTNSFFAVDPMTGKRSDVGVVYPSGRSPYLHTYADGDWNDNLLSLSECPMG